MTEQQKALLRDMLAVEEAMLEKTAEYWPRYHQSERVRVLRKLVKQAKGETR